MSKKLTHIDEHGRASMVDVGHKPDTERTAVARGEIHMKSETLELIRAGQIKKGDVLTVAKSSRSKMRPSADRERVFSSARALAPGT